MEYFKHPGERDNKRCKT